MGGATGAPPPGSQPPRARGKCCEPPANLLPPANLGPLAPLGQEPRRAADERLGMVVAAPPPQVRTSPRARDWMRTLCAPWGSGAMDGPCVHELSGQYRVASLNRFVAAVGGLDALIPAHVRDHAMRTYSGRPNSSIRFSTLAAIATSVVWRPSVCDRSPSPMTRFHLEISASIKARLL
jgi:hypothetical protein